MAETGHAKNLEHFQQIIAYVTNWGPSYNPGQPNLALAELQAKFDASDAAVDTLMGVVADAKVAINDRENAFADIRKRTTRVVNYYEAAGAAENRIADARTLKRKIDGQRKEALKDDPSTPEDETLNGHSVSQQSFTQLVEHFDGLIELLNGDPSYTPNEADLKVPALITYSTSLKTANTGVMNKLVIVSSSRGDRDSEMYATGTGLVDIALAVKKYVKAAFGTDSMEFNQIKGLQFSRVRS